jgi:hypothetical protein
MKLQLGEDAGALAFVLRRDLPGRGATVVPGAAHYRCRRRAASLPLVGPNSSTLPIAHIDRA